MNDATFARGHTREPDDDIARLVVRGLARRERAAGRGPRRPRTSPPRRRSEPFSPEAGQYDRGHEGARTNRGAWTKHLVQWVARASSVADSSSTHR